MLDSPWHDNHLAGVYRDGVIPKLDLQRALDDDERLVGVSVGMPDELPPGLHQLELVVVQLRDDSRRPMITEAVKLGF